MGVQEVVEFKNMTTNCSQRMKGIKISESLVVTRVGENIYKIFSLHNGKQMFDIMFSSIDDAIEVGKWIAEKFEEYLPILGTYPDMDFFQVVKLSVSDGENISNAVEILEREREKVTGEKFFATIEKSYEHG